MVPLSDTEEAGRGAVTSSTFVFVVTWTVEVVEHILVCSSTFATYHEIFVSAAPVDSVPKA